MTDTFDVNEYKQMLEDILEMNKRYVVISGFGDIIFLDGSPIFKGFTKDNYWVIMGSDNDDMIVEAIMMDGAEHVDREGEYNFDAILKNVPGEYDEYGRCTMRGYLEIAWIELNFIQTFEQRDRQHKLDELLAKDMENLFKF